MKYSISTSTLYLMRPYSEKYGDKFIGFISVPAVNRRYSGQMVQIHMWFRFDEQI